MEGDPMKITFRDGNEGVNLEAVRTYFKKLRTVSDPQRNHTEPRSWTVIVSDTKDEQAVREAIELYGGEITEG
jgi:hypothetical protein